jgi:phosphate transport system substrate-binding protein
MKRIITITLALAAMLAMAGMAQARDQIRIVGSSTVYPFSSAVAEEFGATTNFKAPIVESTGSGGGHKLFGAGAGMTTPDITNSSRQMKRSEFEEAMKNGVTGITEAKIGFDGIVVAQNKANADLNLSLKDLALAVLEEVPQGGKLVPNPYKTWKDVNPALPDRKIVIYGPPATSGTRDAFVEMVVETFCGKDETFKAVLGKDASKYKKIRQDGPYVPAGENDNLIVQKLAQDTEAVGIFGYSFLAENSDRIKGAVIADVAPTFDNIASGKYPIARSLFFYVKNDHLDKVPGLKEYVQLFMSDKMIGINGYLKNIGLIPLPAEELAKVQKSVNAFTPLKAEDLK